MKGTKKRIVMKEIKRRMLLLLKMNPEGITITEMSNQLNICRNTVSKYAQMLEAAGKLKIYPFGQARVLRLD